MASTRADAATDLFDRYLSLHAANQTDAVVALFDEHATIEDPVGSPVLHGIDAVRDFYAHLHATNGRLEIERVGPALVCGEELAAHVRAALRRPGSPPAMDVIYTLCLSDAGRIKRLRAFF